jgi:hypothetical protein
MDAKCPSCGKQVGKARLVFIETDTNATKLMGHLPQGGMGYACTSCNTLLPLAPILDRKA